MKTWICCCIALGMASSFFLVDKHDYHWERYSAYDVDGLNSLVGSLSSLKQRQAAALKDVYGITDADLAQPVILWSEKSKWSEKWKKYRIMNCHR